MRSLKSNVELEYELRLTKKILERVLELNKEKNLVFPDSDEIDQIEDTLRSEMEKDYPKYKIQSKS